MSTLDNWFQRLDSFCREYEQALMTEADLEEILGSLSNHPDSPLSAISCEFCRARPFDNICVGQPVADSNPSIHTYPLEDGLGTSCKISLWRRTESVRIHFDPVHTSRRIFELAKCFWKPKMRDTASGLFSLKSPDAYQAVDYSLSRLFRNTNHLYVFFSDLDHFKQVNDTLGQQSGDKVILELASVFDKAVRPSGLVLHLGGVRDEPLTTTEALKCPPPELLDTTPEYEVTVPLPSWPRGSDQVRQVVVANLPPEKAACRKPLILAARPIILYRWSGRRDSNPRPPAWKAGTLPTELLPQ